MDEYLFFYFNIQNLTFNKIDALKNYSKIFREKGFNFRKIFNNRNQMIPNFFSKVLHLKSGLQFQKFSIFVAIL